MLFLNLLKQMTFDQQGPADLHGGPPSTQTAVTSGACGFPEIPHHQRHCLITNVLMTSPERLKKICVFVKEEFTS